MSEEFTGHSTALRIPHMTDLIAARWGGPGGRFLRVSSDNLGDLFARVSAQRSGVTTWSAGAKRLKIASLGRGGSAEVRHVARLRVTDTETHRATREPPPQREPSEVASVAPTVSAPEVLTAVESEESTNPAMVFGPPLAVGLSSFQSHVDPPAPAPVEVGSHPGFAGQGREAQAVGDGHTAAVQVQAAGERVVLSTLRSSAAPTTVGSMVDVLG